MGRVSPSESISFPPDASHSRRHTLRTATITYSNAIIVFERSRENTEKERNGVSRFAKSEMIADHFRASDYSPIITPFVPAPSLTVVASNSRVQLGIRDLPPSTSPQAEWSF